MTADEVRRAIVRIGHEIVEKHGRAEGLALVGIEQGGAVLAERVADAILAGHGLRPPVGSLDVRPYRDDRRGEGERPRAVPGALRHLPFDPAEMTVVLVDDVLMTGRTVRAALDALVARGRPAAVRVAVLVDRGHREMPIRADHVGRNIPTARGEHVAVRLAGHAGEADEVVVLPAVR